MIFHMPQKKIAVPNLKIDNIKIECVENCNYLGIILNKHLNWNSHIDKIAPKISRTIRVLNKLKHFLQHHILLTIYNSRISQNINYGILWWGYNPDSITLIQKEAVRIITGSKYNAHTEPMVKNLKILRLWIS
jgi:hypothetical protein